MDLSERLNRCARTARLSTADLAVLFEIPYGTIRSYRQGTIPYPIRRPQIEERLIWLEAVIASDPRLPIPLRVRATDRAAWLKGIMCEHQ